MALPAWGTSWLNPRTSKSSFTSKTLSTMKKIENNFAVTGFVGQDAEIRQFTTAAVARFPMAVARRESRGEETKRVSAFIRVEAWRKSENSQSFTQLSKGTLLTVEGYFKPEEWVDQDGTKHSRIILVATKFYPAPDKEEAPAPEPAPAPAPAQPQPAAKRTRRAKK